MDVERDPATQFAEVYIFFLTKFHFKGICFTQVPQNEAPLYLFIFLKLLRESN